MKKLNAEILTDIGIVHRYEAPRKYEIGETGVTIDLQYQAWPSVVSDENGVCAFSVLPNAWEMHILMLPEGYEGDMETVWTLAPNGEEIEIVVEKKQK